ncbi:MAG: hypothetical protein RIE24_18900 [Silicimonas sp.]
MALIYLAVSFLAAAAVSFTVYDVSGSLLLGIGAYIITGVVVLFGVLFAALLRDQEELNSMSDPLLFPAE